MAGIPTWKRDSGASGALPAAAPPAHLPQSHALPTLPFLPRRDFKALDSLEGFLRGDCLRLSVQVQPRGSAWQQLEGAHTLPPNRAAEQLAHMFNNPALSDVELVATSADGADSCRLACHRLVLAAASPPLLKMLDPQVGGHQRLDVRHGCASM